MALIGPSGAGKSTVIRCINRLVEPTSGSITLNDVDLVKLGSGDLRRVRRRIGMIFQEYALVERLTVMENVLTGRLGYVGFWQSWLRRFPQSDIDEAFRLLERVGLDHMADKRADELSGGQRQRVGICRALIQNPELLLVDEPTASLDPKTSRQIMRLIKELCGERKLPRSSTSTTSCWRRCLPNASSACGSARSSLTGRRTRLRRNAYVHLRRRRLDRDHSQGRR